MTRGNFGSGYPFDDTYGYSRAVRVGTHVYVSGATARGEALARMPTSRPMPSSASEAGAQMRHVVRTVVYVTNLAFQDAITRAHGEAFQNIRPASTLVHVAALTPRTARVEIEVTAVIAD